jgi:hypothetical protein
MHTIDNRFESTCGHAGCDQRITTRNGGSTWRHDKAPADKHHAYAHGVMKQL